MKKAFLILFYGALVLGIVMLCRALLLAPRDVQVRPAPNLELDMRRVCLRLGQAIRIPSVSSANLDAVGEARLQRMLEFILETFPPVVGALEVERYPRGLVLRWKGIEPSLAPLLLLAHLDVVPVEPESLDEWRFPPFSGEVAGGAIWGRGSLDDKSCAMAMLEAVELLLTRAERPRRDILFAFGLDEEIGGARGAAEQAARFEAEGLQPFMILDEGFAVLDGVIDAVAAPVAGIGIAEKGIMTVRLEANLPGGHASMPERHTAIGLLAAAVARIEEHPMEARMDGAVGGFFDELAREMSFGPRLLFANRWLTESLLVSQLEQQAGTAATLRTTVAVTHVSGGVADNVLPSQATATVNIRLHPRDRIANVLEHLRTVINDDRITVQVDEGATEPSPISPSTGPAWDLLATTIRECYAGAVVAPALVLGATDARHYARLSPNVYRFNGLRLGPDDLERIHGVNERILTRDYVAMIRFYLQLMKNA